MADPAAVRLAQSFQAQLRAADAQAIEHMAKRWGSIEAALQGAIDDLANEIAALQAAGETISQSKLWQMERYQSLLAQVGRELGGYMQWAFSEIKSEALRNQTQAKKHAQMMLPTIAGPQSGASLRALWDKLNTAPTEKITALSQAGAPLEQILQKAYPMAVQGLTNKLLTGAAIGQGPRKIAREMMRGGGLDQALNHILLVARDQQIRNYREASRDIYGASPVVYGYKRLAAKNERTCMACLALDGRVYPKAEVMELHPQDRCSMIPLIVGRPVPEWESGLDWFKKQPEARQRKMMGNGRYEAWKGGEFDLPQIVTIKPNATWGPSAQETPLKVLKGGGGGHRADPPDPSALLSAHTRSQHVPSPKVVDLSNISDLTKQDMLSTLASSSIPGHIKGGIAGAVTHGAGGKEGSLYLSADGQIEGAMAWAPDKDDPTRIAIFGAGFVDEPTNLKAIRDLAQANPDKGITTRIPEELVDRYMSWGFTAKQISPTHWRAELAPGDAAKFVADPQALAAEKLQIIAQDTLDRVNADQGVASFKTGVDLSSKLPWYDQADLPEDLASLQHSALSVDLDPLQVPEGKHAAAGMILYDPTCGKFVLSQPTKGYGGYTTTLPKGTIDEGEAPQDAAIREIWEETGFVARIVGGLGDYEKSTSANRFYIGVVEEGAPWAAGWETSQVHLVPPEKLLDYLGTEADKKIAQDFMAVYEEAKALGPDVAGGWVKGLETIEAQKLERAQELAELQEAAFNAWFYDAQADVASLEMALAYAKKPGAGELVESLREPMEIDLANLKEAEKEAASAAQAEVWKLYEIIATYAADGPDSIATLPTKDLRAAIAFGYESGAPADVIADLEAIYGTRRQEALMAAPVTIPPELTTKSQIVAHLVAETGVTKWKINQLPKAQIEALDGKSAAEVLEAGEAGAAKYYAAKAPKQPDPRPEPIEELIHLPAGLRGATKAKLVAHIVAETGVTKWKISQLTKNEIEALFGQPVAAFEAAAEAGATKYYEAKKAPQPAPVASPAESIKKRRPLLPDLSEYDGDDAAYVKATALALGLPASDFNGVSAYELNQAAGGQSLRAAKPFVDLLVMEAKVPEVYVEWLNAGSLKAELAIMGKQPPELLKYIMDNAGNKDFANVAASAWHAANITAMEEKADADLASDKWQALLAHVGSGNLTKADLSAWTIADLQLAKKGAPKAYGLLFDDVIAKKLTHGHSLPQAASQAQGTPKPLPAAQSKQIIQGKEIMEEWELSTGYSSFDKFLATKSVEELETVKAYLVSDGHNPITVDKVIEHVKLAAEPDPHEALYGFQLAFLGESNYADGIQAAKGALSVEELQAALSVASGQDATAIKAILDQTQGDAPGQYNEAQMDAAINKIWAYEEKFEDDTGDYPAIADYAKEMSVEELQAVIQLAKGPTSGQYWPPVIADTVANNMSQALALKQQPKAQTPIDAYDDYDTYTDQYYDSHGSEPTAQQIANDLPKAQIEAALSFAKAEGLAGSAKKLNQALAIKKVAELDAEEEAAEAANSPQAIWEKVDKWSDNYEQYNGYPPDIEALAKAFTHEELSKAAGKAPFDTVLMLTQAQQYQINTGLHTLPSTSSTSSTKQYSQAEMFAADDKLIGFEQMSKMGAPITAADYAKSLSADELGAVIQYYEDNPALSSPKQMATLQEALALSQAQGKSYTDQEAQDGFNKYQDVMETLQDTKGAKPTPAELAQLLTLDELHAALAEAEKYGLSAYKAHLEKILEAKQSPAIQAQPTKQYSGDEMILAMDKYEDTVYDLAQQLGHPPTAEDLATLLSIEDIEAAIQGAQTNNLPYMLHELEPALAVKKSQAPEEDPQDVVINWIFNNVDGQAVANKTSQMFITGHHLSHHIKGAADLSEYWGYPQLFQGQEKAASPAEKKLFSLAISKKTAALYQSWIDGGKLTPVEMVAVKYGLESGSLLPNSSGDVGTLSAQLANAMAKGEPPHYPNHLEEVKAKYQANKDHLQGNPTGTPLWPTNTGALLELAKAEPVLFGPATLKSLASVPGGEMLKEPGNMPLPPGAASTKSLKYMTNDDLKGHIIKHSALTLADLKGLKKDDLIATIVGPPDPGPAQGSVATALGPDLDLDPESIKQPTGTIDVTGAKAGLLEDIQQKVATSPGFATNSATSAGAQKVIGQIQQGAQSVIYTADNGDLLAMMSLSPQGGNELKVTGITIKDFDTAINAHVIADAINLAEAMGMEGITLWVPDPAQALYTSWGFTQSGSGNYMSLSVNQAPTALMSQATPPGQIRAQTDKGPLPFPPGVESVAALQKTSKAKLVEHVAAWTGAPKAKLNKLAQNELAHLVGKGDVTKMVDEIVKAKEEATALQDAFDKALAGPETLSTSKEANTALQYIQLHNPEVSPAFVDRLRVRAAELEKEERESVPYTPRFTPRPMAQLPSEADLPKHADFPPDPAKLKRISSLGGSTGAELVEDPATGKRYVRKTGNNAGHVRTEVYADEMYRAAGFNVPRAQLYESGGRPVKLAEFIEGRPLADVLRSADKNTRAKIVKQIQDGFAMDALLGNWDVLGANMDNVLVTDEGTVYRIDNGGSLSYRAQGATKEQVDWNGYVTDLWSMREPARSGARAHSGPMFRELSWYTVMDQAQSLVDMEETLLAKVPAGERQILHQRIEHLRDMAATSKAIQRDQFQPEFADELHRHSTNLRQGAWTLPNSGDPPDVRQMGSLHDKLPQRMAPKSRGDVTLYDERGREWDDFKDGFMSYVDRYMEDHGYNTAIFSEYMDSQGHNSFSTGALGMKYHEWLMRGQPEDAYLGDMGAARRKYESYVQQAGGQEKFHAAFMAWRAFVFEALRNTPMMFNDQERGYLQLVRTETSAGTGGHRPDPGQWVTSNSRGVLDSCSLMHSITVHNDHLIAMRVPYHRVMGFYLHRRLGGGSSFPFLGPGENEVVADLTGLPFVLVSNQYSDARQPAENIWQTVAKATGETELRYQETDPR